MGVTSGVIGMRFTKADELAVNLDDELYAITSGGGVIRTPVKGVRHSKDRATMGVKLMNLGEDVTIVAIARVAEDEVSEDSASAS